MIKLILFTLTVIVFSGCSKDFYIAPVEQFHMVKTTQFRYKNSNTKNLYLPKDISVCVLEKTDKLKNTKKIVEEFLKQNWMHKATVRKNCVGVDFYLRIYQTKDLIHSHRSEKDYFTALKLTIIEKKGRKVVADFTVKNYAISDEYTKSYMDEFLHIYLNNKKIFGE